MNEYQYIQVSVEKKAGIIQLNRPDVLNALNRLMVEEIIEQMTAFDQDQAIKVILLKGNEHVFAAGADIEEMMDDTPLSLELADHFALWDQFTRIKKPVIAAVNGFALGGGFELVLHCDLIVAAETAQFGFPEVKLGVMPGAGGTQFLTKAMGRAKALEWLWLGESMSAKVAEHYGMINRVVASELVEEKAKQLAHRLAEQAPIALRLIKEAVDVAVDQPLQVGMQFERKNFYVTFDSQDQKEGMSAFIEKRSPNFKGV